MQVQVKADQKEIWVVVNTVLYTRSETKNQNYLLEVEPLVVQAFPTK